MMTTQLENARAGVVTPQMEHVARAEGLEPEDIRRKVATGRVVVMCNPLHERVQPLGVGEGLRTKVNANFGTAPDRGDIDGELAKLNCAVEAGADAVMDLSTGGDIDAVRRAIVAASPAVLGTVPVYQAAMERGGPVHMDAESFLDVFERHARDGVDFATIHAGLTRAAIPLTEKRVMGAVSRGGSFLITWMRAHDQENFLYERFDDILAIAHEYDVTMSLGDGLRPGCIADATDDAQLHELRVLGELAARCRAAGVQVMIEGPGHVPLQDVERNMFLEKEICDGAPFYVLGPLPTDIAPGYDHIVSAIGGALAGAAGADFLCYVTPREHVGLPGPGDVREGVIVSRIAAHIADIAKGLPGAADQDLRMAKARTARDWDAMQRCALDPVRFAQMLADEDKSDKCSMCGEFCAIKLFHEES
jgi:phosphomethylpyrimidine synthase